MLRASGTPLCTDVLSPGLTGMCLVWHCACSLERDEGPGPFLWSQQLPGARTGHEQTPFAGSRGDWRRAVLHPPHHVVLTACRQGVETILLMWLDGGGLGWHRPCTMSRRVRPWFAYAGLDCGNAFEGHGMGSRWLCPNFRLGGGFASWVHGGRERSSLAFNSRSGVPRPGGWHKYASEKHMPPTMELRTGVDYRMQVGIAWPVPGMRIPPGTTGWLN